MKTIELDENKPVFPISVVADTLQVHQRTLRIYDDEKILVPGRSAKNRRLYSMADLEKGKFIQFLTRDLGINLAGVKTTLNLLEQLKVPSENYIKFIKGVADSLDITPEVQEINRIKLSKRGRKKAA